MPPPDLELLWTYPRSNRDAAALPLTSAPAVDVQGRFYLATQNRVVAFRPDFSALWNRPVGHVPGPTTLGPDGGVRVHAADGLLYCIDPDTGTDRWNPVRVGPPVGHAAPLVDANDMTWISAASGGLLRVSGQGQLTRWYSAEDKLNSGGVILNGVVYLGDEDGTLHAISTQGSQGSNLWAGRAHTHRLDWYINSALAVRTDALVAVTQTALHLIPLTGQPPSGKAFEPPWMFSNSPLVDEDNHIYVGISQSPRGGKSQGRLVCLDAQTVRVRKTYAVSGRLESTPLLGSDGAIYLGDSAGVVHVLDRNLTRSGRGCNVGSPVRSAGVLLAPGRIGFGLEDGRFVVLSCSSRSLATGWPKLLGSAGQSGQVPPRLPPRKP